LREHDLEVDLVEFDREGRQVLRGHLQLLALQLRGDVLLLLGLSLVLVNLGFLGLLLEQLGLAVELRDLVDQVDESVSPSEDGVGQVLRADGPRFGELGEVVVEVEVGVR
jgi:hypothetical protein